MRIYDTYPNQVIKLDYYVLNDRIQVTWCATSKKSSRLTTVTLFLSSFFFFFVVCVRVFWLYLHTMLFWNINIIKGPFLLQVTLEPFPCVCAPLKIYIPSMTYIPLHSSCLLDAIQRLLSNWYLLRWLVTLKLWNAFIHCIEHNTGAFRWRVN